jgi:hypothetical protein
MNFERLVLLAALALGCQPSIGDHCVQSTDCSTTGTRLCDTSQPNGYCTIFNCEPNACPTGSGCIVTNISALGCEYDDRHAPSRFSRQLCLKTCGQTSDCRESEGYACITPADYGLLILDTDQTELVCLPAANYMVSSVDASGSPVCSVNGPVVPAYEAGPGYQGDAGADAAADAESDGAADDAADDASDAADASVD